jgi:hypothetical protein
VLDRVVLADAFVVPDRTWYPLILALSLKTIAVAIFGILSVGRF